MSREAHVRICESARVKFPRATRPFRVRIDLGFKITTVQTLRLRDIDADPLETASGREAKAFLEKRLPRNKPLLIQTFKSKEDQYGRYLASLWVDDSSIEQEMLERGLAIQRPE